MSQRWMSLKALSQACLELTAVVGQQDLGRSMQQREYRIQSRWLWLKNPEKLSAQQTVKLQELLKNQNLKTVQAYQFRPTFQEIFTIQNRHQGAALLKAWMERAKTRGLPPLVKVAYSLMDHWGGVLRWFESQIANGILEGFNSLLQSAKAKARGYRTHKAFIAMAYLSTGHAASRITHLKTSKSRFRVRVTRTDTK
jgi:transposase